MRAARKRGATSFGTIIGIFGAILIALGVVWLLAQNWHQIPRFVKVFILVAATIASYSLGTMLRLREYHGIGKALLVLGALLYTLSIFLIAQMYFTSASFQGTAWLMLLAWIGVAIASYIFDSPVSLAIALLEFLIWLVVQYLAFVEMETIGFMPGVLALVFLSAGVIFYGLSFLHKARDHLFAKLYLGWTAFYFLLFAYILSFQALLPFLGITNLSLSSSRGLFLLGIALLAMLIGIIGMTAAASKKLITGKEVTAVIITAILFILLISLADTVADDVGMCATKNCYDFKNQKECTTANLPHTKCTWQENTRYCTETYCYNLKTKEQCETTTLPRADCAWNANLNSCDEKRCYDFKDKSSCEQASSAKVKCEWRESHWEGTPTSSCEQRYEPSSDLAFMKCNEYSNNKDACVQKSECTWQPGAYYSFFNRDKVSFSMWFLWIFANIVFLAVILGVIGYGTWQHTPAMINLGISFFALDVITRYIGFIIDFWGYTTLAIIFITGGILLIGGGWLIERWRRNLLAKTK